MIVVADEVFTMYDKQLSQIARLSVPNTLKESSMVVTNPVNRSNPAFKRLGSHNHPRWAAEKSESLTTAKSQAVMNTLFTKSEQAR